MAGTKLTRVKTISAFHELRGLPGPAHPLVSVIDLDNAGLPHAIAHMHLMFNFYFISIKKAPGIKYKYGQQDFDFNSGLMSFMAPNQVFSIEVGDNAVKTSGWLLLIHPDFLWNMPLAKTVKQYAYFDYSVNEALFLSEKEEAMINSIMANIRQECNAGIDKFSRQIILSQIETLLGYAERFYHRQFITREKASHQLLARLEKLLTGYFSSGEVAVKGLPTVQYVAGQLNVSPKYLSSLLKVLTGQNTQQHIHEKLIEAAKEKLSTTSLSVSEIAYELGFEHLQSFSKLFKAKTSLSPVSFRQSFN